MLKSTNLTRSAGGLAARLLFVLPFICLLATHWPEAKRIKCQAEECNLREEHFKLYSSIKKALDVDFYMKGKDIVPLMRSVEVLKRRFVPASVNQPEDRQLNGTKLVLALLESDKLRRALDAFNSDEGRALVNLYRGSINGNHQNLACSQWRVSEIEFAAKRLEQSAKLAEAFGNIHKDFVERSARKCLKSSCSSIDDNMNRLDSIQRHSNRRKGFIAREDLTGKLYGENSGNPLDELVEQVENEPLGEFYREELELCHLFKRTNESQCRASGNELSEISFVKAVKVNNSTVQSSLEEYLRDYRRNKRASGPAGATVDTSLVTDAPMKDDDEAATPDRTSSFLLAQCRSLQPLLGYHAFGLRWYQRHDLIAGHKLRARTFWCPSLSYWLEIDRLCNELEVKLAGAKSDPGNHGSFAY